MDCSEQKRDVDQVSDSPKGFKFKKTISSKVVQEGLIKKKQEEIRKPLQVESKPKQSKDFWEKYNDDLKPEKPQLPVPAMKPQPLVEIEMNRILKEAAVTHKRKKKQKGTPSKRKKLQENAVPETCKRIEYTTPDITQKYVKTEPARSILPSSPRGTSTTPNSKYGTGCHMKAKPSPPSKGHKDIRCYFTQASTWKP